MQVNWQRLHIFSTVASEGSLTAAAKRLGLSQPTVGRQVRALEEELGADLFERTAHGLALTPAGAELRPIVEDMRRAAEAAVRLAGDAGNYHGTVRISCGQWMARFLAGNLQDLTNDLPEVRIVIVNSYAFADVGRREAEIAIRNRRPGHGRMVVRRLPGFTYAAYGHRSFVARYPEAQTDERYAACPWAGFDEANDHLPTAMWLAERRGALPDYQFTQSINILDTVKAGAALGILPCFVADHDGDLRRVSPPFQPVPEGNWLVINEDLRRAPHVRAVVERLTALFEARRELLDPQD